MFNSLISNLNGITIEGDGNTIFNNTIKNNYNYGIYTGSTSHNNLIYSNRFITEKNYVLAFEEGLNQWDYNEIGNYWSDYLGPDNDENGIGDIPYDQNNVVDQYPTGKFHKLPTVSDPTPEHLAEDVDLHPTLSVTVDDKEDERLDVSFYYILDNESHLIETVTNVECGEEASVAFYSTVQGQNAVYTYLGAGYDYIGVWYATVTDTYSTTTSESWVFSTRHVPVDNDPPASVITGPDSAETDELIPFNASSSNDPDGTIAFYRWSFGDGSNIINDKTPEHMYDDPGVYNVSLVVIDDNGSSASSTKQITISAQKNDPPTANVNGPYTTEANTYISFTSLGSSDPDPHDDLTYEWSFGDGNSSSQQHPTYKYSNGGNYSVNLTVTDEHGLSDSSSTYALIIQPKKESTPGFELLFFIIGIILIYLIQNKKRKIK
jgi:PKD repeat protein